MFEKKLEFYKKSTPDSFEVLLYSGANSSFGFDYCVVTRYRLHFFGDLHKIWRPAWTCGNRSRYPIS